MADSKPSETVTSQKDVSKGSYTFPLRNRDDYKGKVTFKVVEVERLTAGALANLDWLSDQENANSNDKRNASTEEPTEDQTPEQKEAEIEQARISKEKLKKKVTNTTWENPNKVKKYGGQVSLYMPQQLTIRDAVQYENLNLGTIGAGVDAGMKGGGSALGSAVSGMAEGINSFIDSFSSSSFDTPLAGLAASRAASKFGDQVGGAVRMNTRTTINPNTRSLFQSVALREMPFTFRLVATSKEEAEEIKKIITLFRSELYPSNIPGNIGDAEISIGYILPNLFEITMTYDDKPVATQFLDSYLRDVSVTYNPNGAAMHSDGNFTEVEIALTFIESKTLVREDIEKGY